MQPVFEYFSSVKPKDVEWLWYPYIPYGKLTILQGDPGEGKSTFMLHLIGIITSGGRLPDGNFFKSPHSVIYQCAEDNIADTIKPRLLAARADCNKVAYILDDDQKLTLEDIRLEDAIIKTGARLLVLDPLQSFLTQETDMHSMGKMRGSLKKLSAIAEKHCCAIVLVGHMNKGGSNKNLYRGLGSIDIAAIARSVLMIVRDKDEPEQRYLFQIKSSLAPEGLPISFSLSREHGLIWEAPTDISIHEVECEEILEDNKRGQAVALLMQMLMERDMPSTEIFAVFNKIGISRRTVQTAKKDACIQAYRKDNMWYWSIPKKIE